jgi:parallel beta-helix repeat protein
VANIIKKIIFLLLGFSLFILPSQYVFASGIGFKDFNGSVTISNSTLTNNLVGIQATTINVANIANILVEGNVIDDSQRHGIKIDLANTGAISIENNILDNSNAISNGRFGIRIQNHSSPYIAGNTVQNFGRSGIQLLDITNITVVNNYLFSNGSQDYESGGEHFASGLQTKDSTFVNVTDNIIISNHFSGIAAYGTAGTIGNNNSILYNGVPDSGTAGEGSLENCVGVPSGGTDIRGGILARIGGGMSQYHHR